MYRPPVRNDTWHFITKPANGTYPGGDPPAQLATGKCVKGPKATPTYMLATRSLFQIHSIFLLLHNRSVEAGRQAAERASKAAMVAERAFALDVSQAVQPVSGLEADFQAMGELMRSMAMHTTFALESTHFGFTEIFRWIALITAV